MQELEKIMEEIENARNEYPKARFPWYVNGMRDAENIIRKHMNDGWIPVEERLPTMEEYQKNNGEFILENGNRRYAGYYDVYTGRFYSYRHITLYRAELYEDNRIIAWRPLPDPYQPEREGEKKPNETQAN